MELACLLVSEPSFEWSARWKMDWGGSLCIALAKPRPTTHAPLPPRNVIDLTGPCLTDARQRWAQVRLSTLVDPPLLRVGWAWRDARSAQASWWLETRRRVGAKK